MSDLIFSATINTSDHIDCPVVFGMFPRKDTLEFLIITETTIGIPVPHADKVFVPLDRDGVVHFEHQGVFVILATSDTLLQERIKWLMLDDDTVNHSIH